MNIKNKTILVHQSSVDKSKKLEYRLCVLCPGLTSGVSVLETDTQCAMSVFHYGRNPYGFFLLSYWIQQDTVLHTGAVFYYVLCLYAVDVMIERNYKYHLNIFIILL